MGRTLTVARIWDSGLQGLNDGGGGGGSKEETQEFVKEGQSPWGGLSTAPAGAAETREGCMGDRPSQEHF